jgi:UDP-glucose 4-epimerase
MKKILITGGAGFIGSHLVEAYIHEGHSVVVVDNFSTGKKKNIHPQAKIYAGDITDQKFLWQVFVKEKPDVVNHHAAQVSVMKSIESPVLDANTNLFGLVNLLNCCVNHNVEKLILASSGGAIYSDMVTQPSTESDELNPLSPYGLSKKNGEMYVKYFHQIHGLPYLILRYANVYGARQNFLEQTGVISLFLNNILKKREIVVYGDGNSTRDYIYIEDVISANILSLKSKEVGVFNISTGKEVSMNQLVDVMRKIDGSVKVRYEKAREGEKQRSVLDFTNAKRKLGWTPKVTLDQGIEKYLNLLQKKI